MTVAASLYSVVGFREVFTIRQNNRLDEHKDWANKKKGWENLAKSPVIIIDLDRQACLCYSNCAPSSGYNEPIHIGDFGCKQVGVEFANKIQAF